MFNDDDDSHHHHHHHHHQQQQQDGDPTPVGNNPRVLKSTDGGWQTHSRCNAVVFAHAQGTAPWNMFVLSMGWGGVGC